MAIPQKSRARPRDTFASAAADVATEAERWRAVEARDPRFDGTFYFAVATTGVYCRPSCPARRARRENVTFYASCADAERAGFRPCKRCTPRASSSQAAHAALIAAACRRIEAAEEPPALAELARAARLSPHHFQRVFKAVAGLTPKAYAAAHRQRRLREELPGAGSVTEAAQAAGYNSSGRFYAEAPGALGMTPTAFRAGGADAVLSFAVGRSALGAVLVAATDKGIAAILLGDDPAALADELQQRFPKAALIAGDGAFADVVAAAVRLVDTPTAAFDLPLDIRGTAFQHRVWQELRKIPPGSTATYSQIAARIGRPEAVRAVAGACAANPIAVAVPCHRVVRGDGSLSGYRWGVERKRELLAREAGGAAPRGGRRGGKS